MENKMYRGEEQGKVQLQDYARVIIRRKWVLFVFAMPVLLVVGIGTFLATPKYKAKATLLIEEKSSKIMSIEDEFGYQRQMSDLRFFNTQLILLKSESLAERVARKMKLLSQPDFEAGNEQKKSLATKVKSIITFSWISSKKNPKETVLIHSDPYSEIVKKIQNSMDVSPIRDTKVMKVSYTSANPLLAAEIANKFAEEFITFSIEKRYEATQRASDFLSEQIGSLREGLAAKERELQKYRQEKELFFLSDDESTAVRKFAEMDDAYTQAQIERVKAEAAYRELKGVNADSIPQSVSDLVIQQLKAEYSRIKNEYEEKSKIFKPDYPEMAQLKAKLDSMKEELKKAVDTAASEYRAALNKEKYFKSLLEKQRQDVDKMDSSAILYNSLKIEVENKRKLLDSLVEKQNETMVSAKLGGFKIGNISIIDKAKVPKSPVSPKKKLNLILALLIGIFGGVGLCFFFEYLDNTVKGPEEVERMAGLPSLGVIPYLEPKGMKKKRYGYYSGHKGSGSKGKVNPGARNGSGERGINDIKDITLINYHYPKFSISEDYRTVRTSILLSHTENHPKTIAFSSTLPEEGKTVTVANMAVAFAQLGKRVLIVDSDLRKPRLHRLFKVRNVKGLSGYLAGKVSIEDVIQKTNIENVSIIPSGIIPPNPAELLDSEKMRGMVGKGKEEYDVVLFDSPPVLAVVDPMIIGSFVDCVALIVEGEKTKQKPFLKAVEQLRHSKAKIIGVIFNKARVRKGDYYYMDYYYQYRGGRGYGGEE